jgi:hypothetical protein
MGAATDDDPTVPPPKGYERDLSANLDRRRTYRCAQLGWREKAEARVGPSWCAPLVQVI